MTPPVDLGRDAAREAAEQELRNPAYRLEEPSPMERALTWLLERLQALLAGAESVAPGGYPGLVLLLALGVLVAVALRLAIGRIGRTAAGESAVFATERRSAAWHRRAADEHAARADWAAAARERLRAVVRDLEDRDLLEARPGRTAREAAAEAGAALPACAAGLREAAGIFDDVCYGGRPAMAAMDARIREVDAQVRAARPVLDGGVRS